MEQMESKHQCDLERSKRKGQKKSGKRKDAENPPRAQNTLRSVSEVVNMCKK